MCHVTWNNKGIQLALEHKGWEGVTNSYNWHSIKPQQISWKDRVFVTFRGGLEHAGGWNRSFTPKYCLSSSQCFSWSFGCSLLGKNINERYYSTVIAQSIPHFTVRLFTSSAQILTSSQPCASGNMEILLLVIVIFFNVIK